MGHEFEESGSFGYGIATSTLWMLPVIVPFMFGVIFPHHGGVAISLIVILGGWVIPIIVGFWRRSWGIFFVSGGIWLSLSFLWLLSYGTLLMGH